MIKNNGLTENLFQGLLEHSNSRIIFICFSSLITIFVILLNCGIIWYEKFGSNLRRIFINKMISSVCWCAVTFLILVQIPDIAFFVYLPFPEFYCLFYLLCRNAIALQMVLFLDAIVIFKYISIFWLINPLNFNDDFWSLFVNIWVAAFRLVIAANNLR